MPRALHKDVRTTPAVGDVIAPSDETASVLVQCFDITKRRSTSERSARSLVTVRIWPMICRRFSHRRKTL
jgi:hypothetical protein